MGKEIRTYRWEILDGEGTIDIMCDENAANDTAHAMVEKSVSRGLPFGMGQRRFTLVDRRPLT